MVVELTRSYLRARQQCVTVNGAQSEFSTESSGVPQGSVLGPQFFNCLVNAAPESLTNGSELVQYADDFLIF